MQNTTGKVRMYSEVMFSDEHLHMDTPDLADQQKLIFNCPVQTVGVV